MNAPFPLASVSVSTVDLSDPSERLRLEGFVREMKGTVFQRPDWLLAVETGTGQRAVGLVAERLGSLTGWLPLTLARSPIFGRALVSSGFAVGGGVLADNNATMELLCRAAEELAVRHSCSSVEIRADNFPADWSPQSGRHCGFVSDLAEDDEAQLLAVPRKQRAEIRKSLKLPLEVTVGCSERDRAAHYATYAASVHNLGTPVFPRSLFDAMLDCFDNDADILTVWYEDKPVSSVLSFYHQEAVLPYWGGGTFAARQLRANERMYYELMLHARKRGCERFDFGRSKTGSGPYHYKKNWGFEPQPLTYGCWSAPNSLKRDTDPTSGSNSAKVELWKKLPPAIANRLGPFIASGLA